MRTFLVIFLLVAMLSPVTAIAKDFGKGVTLSEETAISSILDTPADYVGKKVKVSGLIIDVCSTRGCWIYLAGDRDFEKIRIKVTDGEIVFPVEAKGKPVQAEGIFAKMELDAEQAQRYRKHMAEELGEAYDPEAESGPMVVFRIDGVGATIR